MSDAFSSLDGVSRPPRPRFFGVGFCEGTGRAVSCVVSWFLAVVGVAGHVCMGAGRAVSCIISRLLVVAVNARHPRALAWSFVSSLKTWLSGCLEQVNQGRASVSSSGTNMPGTFPAPLVIVVPDSLVRSPVSPISVPIAASQMVATQEASACPSKPAFIKSLRPGRYYPQYRDRSVVSWGNSTEKASASHSMPVSQESGNVMTSQKTCVEAPGFLEPEALLLCEEGKPAVKAHRYAGNAALGSPYKISVGKKSPALRGVQQTRKRAPLVSRQTPMWMVAPLVTEALSVACKLGSMFGLKVHQGEQVNDSDRNPEDEMDFEPTSTVVAPVDREVLMQDAPGPIDDDSSTDEMDWEPSFSRLRPEVEALLVWLFRALSLECSESNCITDRVRKPASSSVTVGQSVSSGSEPALKKAVPTVSQAPVEVNQGPHAPSATKNAVSMVRQAPVEVNQGPHAPSATKNAVSVVRQAPVVEVNQGPHAPSATPKPVRKITLRVGSTSANRPPHTAPGPSANTASQPEQPSCKSTGENGRTPANQPPLLTAPGPSANTASQPKQPSCESTGENGCTPVVTKPAAAANSPAPTLGSTPVASSTPASTQPGQAGPATSGRKLVSTRDYS